MPSLSIVIPVYVSTPLHLEFTRETIASIRTQQPYQVFIINNYCSPAYQPVLDQLAADFPHLTIIDNPKGNILASAWNLGINLSFSREKNHSSFCLLLNNDLILHPKAIDHLVKFAHTYPDFLLWSASEWPKARTLTQAKLTLSWSPHPHFSCFMVSPQTIKTIGYFDEHFTGGYFEDNDYHTRILVAGKVAAATDSAKFYHYGSRTVNVDDDLKVTSQKYYQQNRQYFKKKWGVDIHQRAFSPPEAILQELKPTPNHPSTMNLSPSNSSTPFGSRLALNNRRHSF